jgi:hypothetical protein
MLVHQRVNHISKPSHNRHDEKDGRPAENRSLGSDAQQRVSLCDLLTETTGESWTPFGMLQVSWWLHPIPDIKIWFHIYIYMYIMIILYDIHIYTWYMCVYLYGMDISSIIVMVIIVLAPCMLCTQHLGCLMARAHQACSTPEKDRQD